MTADRVGEPQAGLGAVLARHVFRGRTISDGPGCYGCDWTPPSDPPFSMAPTNAHRAHVAAKVRAWLAAELTRPEVVGDSAWAMEQEDRAGRGDWSRHAAHPGTRPGVGGGHVSDPIERWLHPGECTGRVSFPFLDEFIAHNVDIHYETMGDTAFWLSVRCRETGREWHINCGAINSRAKGYSRVDQVAP